MSASGRRWDWAYERTLEGAARKLAESTGYPVDVCRRALRQYWAGIEHEVMYGRAAAESPVGILRASS